MTLYLNGAEALAFLTVIKRLFGQYQGASELLFDNDDLEQWLGMDRLADLSTNPDLQATRESNSQLIFHHLVNNHADPYVRFLAFAIVSHYSELSGRSDNIADNRTISKKAKDLNLMPELCQSLVRCSNPVHVYNLLNMDTVDLAQIFHKEPKSNTKKRK